MIAPEPFCDSCGMVRENHNIDSVRSIYSAFTRGDIPGILSCMDESIVFIVPGAPSVPLAGIRRGLEQVEQYYRELAHCIEYTLFEQRELIAQGNRVVALIHYEGRYKPGGGSFAVDSAMLWTLGNGKALRFQEFTDTAALVRAARTGGAVSDGR